MIGHFTIAGRSVRVDFSQGTCIAIPMNFSGPQPSHFGADPARAEPMRAGNFVGDTRLGGSCNVAILTLNPHCNGTHTESVAHIVNELVPVHEAMPAGPIPATLLSVVPVAEKESGESYHPPLEESDLLITAHSLKRALSAVEPPQENRPGNAWHTAVLIRTLPNTSDKFTRRYAEAPLAAHLSLEAIDWLMTLGAHHLLVDVPSVDSTHDQGLLTIHHRFWNVPAGSHTLAEGSHRDRTITELIYVPDSLRDGRYLLEMQIPAFSIDVAPSRPWLYPVEFI